MTTYAEINERGLLCNICNNKPETRNTSNPIVELARMPDVASINPTGEMGPIPLKYDEATKTAVLCEETYAEWQQEERKGEILNLVRQKNEMLQAQNDYGVDYSIDLERLEARLQELTS